MENLWAGVSAFLTFAGVALLFHGFSFVTIHKHYHYDEKSKLEKEE